MEIDKSQWNAPNYEDIHVFVEDDPNAESPRNMDNLGTFAMYHRRQDLGDEKVFSDPQKLMDWIRETDTLYLPVYMIDHSNISLSTKPFVDPWDSGQVGVIYVTSEEIRKTYGADTPETRKMARSTLEHEIKDLAHYVEGETYRYRITAPDGTQIESQGNYYGDQKACLEDARGVYLALCEAFTRPEEEMAKDNNFYCLLPKVLRTEALSERFVSQGGDISHVPEELQTYELAQMHIEHGNPTSHISDALLRETFVNQETSPSL